MTITDTISKIGAVFDSGCFDLAKWEAYIEECVPGAKDMFLDDMNDCVRAGYSWENDFLPVLNSVMTDREKWEETVKSFHAITECLDERIVEVFRKSVDADIILYLGLCNGAGWVTKIGGRTTVLLGIEKIMELGWGDKDHMTGLIVHELGHVYQSQYGKLYIDAGSTSDEFLWQLFTEGVAMVFEQEVIGDAEYFHQNSAGWKDWCGSHAEFIKRSFYSDLNTMTQENQRYFGDWVRFEGRGDTGYYLGAMFVRYLLQFDSFDNIINYGIKEVQEGYKRFMLSSV